MISNSQIDTKLEFRKITGEGYTGNITYKHLLAKLMCNPATQSCWLGECQVCEDTSSLTVILEKAFEDLDVDTITYRQWESTDRTELATHTDSTNEFIEQLIEKLQILKTHQFIHDQQTRFYYSLKENLKPGVVIAVGDFSQNYAFVIQDAAQGVHWSKSSCTLHPWVCYYRGQNGLIKTYSLLFISDHLTHDTVAVYAFQEKLIPLLKTKLEQEEIILEKIEYNFDGCSRQYKNKKNFLNLTFHEIDFGIPANCSFSATSHGKGPWDGVAGSAKREAAMESLRRPTEDQILTPMDFFNFIKEKFRNLQVEFISSEAILKLKQEVLVKRFKLAKTIKGTLGLHRFLTIPGNQTQLKVKKFGLSDCEETVSVVKMPTRPGK